MVVDVVTDCLDQLSDALQHVVSNTVLRQIPEPAFDDIQP